MATATVSIDLTIPDNTAFRAFCQQINDWLSAAGWVKETVSGEINLTTVNKPGEGWAGFQIWRMADSLQTIAPVFLYIEYGLQYLQQGGSSHTGPALRVQIGTAHAGGGVITGSHSTRVICAYPQTVDCWYSGSTSRFCLSLGTMVLNIERTSDAGGSDTAEGAVNCGVGWIYNDNGTLQNTSYRFYDVLTFGADNYLQTTWPALVPESATGMVETEVSLYPLFVLNPGLKQPMRGLLLYFDGELATGSTYSVDFLGKPRTYKATGQGAYSATTRGSELRIATRYE